MHLRNSKLYFRIFGLLCTAIGLTSILGTTSVYAYNANYINAQLPGGTATAVGWDKGCWDVMSTNRANGQAPRTAINNGGSYTDMTWVSAGGQGARTTITADYGTKTLDLQLNAITFLCSALVSPDGAGADYGYDNFRVVHAGDAPNDRAPNPMGGGNINPNWPARTDNRFRIDSATSSDSGAISLPSGSVLQNGRNESTRYWFGAQPFVYTSPSKTGMTSEQKIIITVSGRPMVQYHGTQVYCVQAPPEIQKGGFVYDNCKQTTSQFTITVKIKAKYDLMPVVSADKAKNSAVQPGTSTEVLPRVTNAGPTPSNPAAWQLSRFIVKKGNTYPSGVKESDANPATHYGNNLTSIDDGSKTFAVGGNSLNSATQVIPDEPIGARICYALSVKPYTQDSSQWRHGDPYCFVIGKYPKVQIIGGDLVVGRAFDGNSTPAKSDVKTSTTVKERLAVQYTFGSWVEYGIFATGSITGAASGSAYAGSGLAGVNICNTTKLSFTNAGDGTLACGKAAIGGYKTERSIPNIATSFPISGATSLGNDAAITLDSSKQGVYTASGAVSITGGGGGNVVDKGQWFVLNAPDATVTITDNIIYTPDALQSVYDIPQVVIIAKNINIVDSVSRVDAWLVARGTTTGNDGKLNTCSSVSGTALSETGQLSSDICNQQLRVNGPVMAQKLFLRRTAGSGAGLASGNPAEVFNFRPDAYLWASVHASGSGRIQTVHTTELPPRL